MLTWWVETLTLSGTGTIASKDVGSNKTVSVGTLALGMDLMEAKRVTIR